MELPDAVRIREVGPRDGFQNEPETIATADKVRPLGSHTLVAGPVDWQR